MLQENTLFGEVDKVKIAIERIKMFEPLEGYWLAFSGGKDSQCIYHLTVESGVKFDAHFNLTTVDSPEVVRFIKQNYPDVEIHKPKKTMWQLIVENGIPPTRIARYCCRELKENGGENRVLMTGIRWKESTHRSKRQMVENCKRVRLYTVLVHPIIDWSESEVWEYLNSKELSHCTLYDEGYKRIGCIMCPFHNQKEKIKEIVRFPTYYRAYLRAFKKMLLNNKTTWKTEQEVMDWWIYESDDNKTDSNQIGLFE